MRELKFRAWDKRKKCFLHSSFGDKMFPDFIKRVNNAESRYVLDKFTGIKDKSGNEIFFGDRLIFTDKMEWYRNEYWPKVATGVMTRDKALDEIDKKPYEERVVESIEDYDWLLLDEIQTYWKVIGNIHE